MENPWARGDRYFDIAIDDFNLRYNGAAGSITLRARWVIWLASPALAREDIYQLLWRLRRRWWRRRRRRRWGRGWGWRGRCRLGGWRRRWWRCFHNRSGCRWWRGNHRRGLGRLGHGHDRRCRLHRDLHFGRRHVGRRWRHNLGHLRVRWFDLFRRRRWGRGWRRWNDHFLHHDGFQWLFQELQTVTCGTGDQGPAQNHMQNRDNDQADHLARGSFRPLNKTHGRRLTGRIVRCR